MYSIGVAIATSGSTTSHFLMWYSIHSLWIEMSPSWKLKSSNFSSRLIAVSLRSMPWTS